MTSDERALQWLADANPILNHRILGMRSFESVDLTVHHLPRRGAMQSQQTPTDRSTPSERRRWPAWTYAAAVIGIAVVVGATVWMLLSGGNESPVAASETTAASFTRKAPEAVLVSLTWENETCTYEGPTELTAGPVELVYVNGSDISGNFNFLMLDEGYAVEDAYNRGPWPNAEPGGGATFWMHDFGTWWDPVAAGRTFSWVFDLEPADYFMVCGRTQPVIAVWWGGGFTVEG